MEWVYVGQEVAGHQFSLPSGRRVAHAVADNSTGKLSGVRRWAGSHVCSWALPLRSSVLAVFQPWGGGGGGHDLLHRGQMPVSRDVLVVMGWGKVVFNCSW